MNESDDKKVQAAWEDSIDGTVVTTLPSITGYSNLDNTGLVISDPSSFATIGYVNGSVSSGWNDSIKVNQENFVHEIILSMDHKKLRRMLSDINPKLIPAILINIDEIKMIIEQEYIDRLENKE